MGGWIQVTVSYSTRTRGCQTKLAGIMFKTKTSRLLEVEFLPTDALDAKNVWMTLRGDRANTWKGQLY